MKQFISWLKENIWQLIVAFFLARAAMRILGNLVEFSGNFYFIVVGSLMLQGVIFGILFSLMKKRSINIIFCAASAVVTAIFGLPLVYLGLSGYIDPRWMLAGIPATFVALGFTAMRLEPRTGGY